MNVWMKQRYIPPVAIPTVVRLVFTFRALLVPAFRLRVVGVEALRTRVVGAVKSQPSVEGGSESKGHLKGFRYPPYSLPQSSRLYSHL